MTVYLVGAGPGDPGLITVRGQAILKIADVIIHDRLISLDLLRLARADARIIHVGKTPDGQRTSQDEINAMLIDYGGAGKTVARLKGGDPFVFGRGGEEILSLKAAGIPVEVVPGITSALAAPAYAGVPATQRGLSTSFTVVTGHDTSNVDFDALAHMQGLIFMMGVRRLPSIVAALMQRGRAADTPVVCVEWGTFPQQRVVSGTLATIVDIAQQADLRFPSVIVIGAVAGLAESMAWRKNSLLADKRIAIGSIARIFPDLGAHLTALGAFVTNFSRPDSLDVLIVGSADEARRVADSRQGVLVCCDDEATAILRAADLEFVEIEAETGREFVMQLEKIVQGQRSP